MASATTKRAVRYNMPGYQGNQVSMVYLYSDQEKIGGIHDYDYRNVVTVRSVFGPLDLDFQTAGRLIQLYNVEVRGGL